MSHKPKNAASRPRRPAVPRRPLLLWLAGVLVFGALAWWAWRANMPAASPDAAGRPSLQADKHKVDLGDVQLGQTVAVSFELTNTGSVPLRFKERPYVEVVEGC